MEKIRYKENPILFGILIKCMCEILATKATNASGVKFQANFMATLMSCSTYHDFRIVENVSLGGRSL